MDCHRIKFRALLFVLLLGLACDLPSATSQAIASQPTSSESGLRYEMSVDMDSVRSHRAHITMTTGIMQASSLRLTMHAYHGHYPISILNFTASTENQKVLPFREYYEEGDRFWSIQSQGSVKIVVHYDVVLGTIRGNYDQHLGFLGEDFGTSMAEWVFLVPADDLRRSIGVEFVLPSDWKAFAPWKQDGNVFLPPSLEHLATSTFAIGHFDAYSRNVEATNVTLAIYSGWSPQMKKKLADTAFSIFEYQTDLFGKSVGDLYLGAFCPFADDGKQIWGGEYSQSQGVSIRSSDDVFSLVSAEQQFSHQVFHRWNAWEPYGMRMDSDEEQWFSEGANVLYESKILVHLGVMTEHYTLRNFYSEYVNTYVGTSNDMPVAEAGRYHDPTRYSSSEFIMYHKGALTCLLLDISILNATNGERDLGRLLKNMYSIYAQRKGSYSNNDILIQLNRIAEYPFADFFKRYIRGIEKIPLDQSFTSLKLLEVKRDWNIGEQTELAATLKDFNGTSMAGEIVTFYVDCMPISSATTDSQGLARTFYALNRTGELAFGVIYHGSKDYTRLQSSDLFTITVESRTAVTGSRVYAAQEYFPLAIGNSWKYSWINTRYLPNPVVETMKVVSVLPVICINATISERASGYFEIRRATDGLYWTDFGTRWHGGQDPFPVPMYMILHYTWAPTKLLPVPLTVGESWTEKGSVPGRSGKEEYFASSKVVRFESVGTPAGTFDCILIESAITAGNDYVSGTRRIWLADGVGLVKLVYQHDGGSTTEAQLLEYALVTQRTTTMLSQSGLLGQIPGGYLTLVGIGFVAVLVIVAFSLVRRKKQGGKGTSASR